jgi:hypothetical protein
VDDELPDELDDALELLELDDELLDEVDDELLDALDDELLEELAELPIA